MIHRCSPSPYLAKIMFSPFSNLLIMCKRNDACIGLTGSLLVGFPHTLPNIKIKINGKNCPRFIISPLIITLKALALYMKK